MLRRLDDFRSGRWNLDNYVCRFTNNFGLEALDWIGSVCDSPNETVRIDNRIAAFDDVAIAALFAILVVGEFVIFDVEAELVGRILLELEYDKSMVITEANVSRIGLSTSYSSASSFSNGSSCSCCLYCCADGRGR